MKYLEELQSGETFKIDGSSWLITADFKSNGQRLCYSLQNGYAKWFDSNAVIEATPVYILDKDNNILPVKEYKNENYKLS